MIKVSICVSDVDKAEIKESKGKKYLNVVVADRKEKGKYGETHTVFMDRDKGQPIKYVGSGKELSKEQKVSDISSEGGAANDLPF